MNYYLYHINDFHFATRHLSLIERAIYRDLLDIYYDTEKAIDASNLDRLARRLQCTTEEMKVALSYVLEEFFTLRDGFYFNNRCEREIIEYHSKRKQASEAGKISAKKRAEKKQQNTSNGSSGSAIPINESPTADDVKLNENSTTVEDGLNENATTVQLTSNHKPVTSNHKPVTSNHEPVTSITDSSNVQNSNLPFPPIQFSQYKAEDRKRYELLECVNVYPLQQDFIDLAIARFPDVPQQDLIELFTNYGNFFVSKGEEAKNTPSLWLVKWFTWIQNNKDDVSRKRKDKKESEELGYFNRVFNTSPESDLIDVTPDYVAGGLTHV